MAREFGAIPGVAVGTTFPDRRVVAAADVHKPLIAGISGGAKEGADSIVISGGYEDDEDYGDVIVYTGHGGQDDRNRQVSDQTLTAQNLALAVSCDRGLPIRVVRGSEGDPASSPPSGYRYDGLFYIERYRQATGRSGFNIWRYRLVAEPSPNPVTNPPPQPPPGAGTKAFASVQRIVRNTAVTEWVKDLYAATCQVCGETIHTAAGAYAEGAHLRPVGSPHHGPDAVENVLCLCPNDHVRLDRGAIGFDGSWNAVEISTGAVLSALTVHPKHVLDSAHAAYHRAMFA